MSSVLSSMFESRIFYNWRMAKRGGGYLVGSLIAAGASGLFIAATRHAPRLTALGLSTQAAFGGFLAMALLSGILWWRFSSRQDEMFHRIQNYSYGWGGATASTVLVLWGLAFGAGLAPPIDPIAPLLVFALAKSFFWTAATRHWL